MTKLGKFLIGFGIVCMLLAIAILLTSCASKCTDGTNNCSGTPQLTYEIVTLEGKITKIVTSGGGCEFKGQTTDAIIIRCYSHDSRGDITEDQILQVKSMKLLPEIK